MVRDLRIARRLFLVRTEVDFLFAESRMKVVPRARIPLVLCPVRSGRDYVLPTEALNMARTPRFALGLIRLRGAVDYQIAELRVKWGGQRALLPSPDIHSVVC